VKTSDDIADGLFLIQSWDDNADAGGHRLQRNPQFAQARGGSAPIKLPRNCW
jgi:hypothetical protein